MTIKIAKHIKRKIFSQDPQGKYIQPLENKFEQNTFIHTIVKDGDYNNNRYNFTIQNIKREDITKIHNYMTEALGLEDLE